MMVSVSINVQTMTREELEGRLAELQSRLEFVERPENNPWLIRDEISAMVFLLGGK